MARSEKKVPVEKTVAEGITKRTNGGGKTTYVVRVYNPLTKQRENHTAESLEEARKIKRREEHKKAARQQVSRKETVESWSRRWMEVFGEGRTESTRKTHLSAIKPFVRDFGSRTMASVSPEEARVWIHGGPVGPDVEKHAEKWHDVKREATGMLWVPSHTAAYPAVRTMFMDALKIGIITVNPFLGLNVGRGRGRSDMPDVLTRAEVDELVQIAGQVHGVYGTFVFGPAIQIAAWTGLRPGEMFALFPEDIDLERRIADVEDGRYMEMRAVRPGDPLYEQADPAPELMVRRAYSSKTSKMAETKNHLRRRVPLLPGAVEAFETLFKGNPKPGHPILRTTHGKTMNQRHQHYYWDPIRTIFAATRPEGHWLPARVEKDGVKGNLDLYELRHFFATRLVEMGVPAPAIAEAMGHRDGGALAMRVYMHSQATGMLDQVHRYARRAA